MFGDFSVPITRMMIGDNPPEDLARAMHGSWVSSAAGGDPAATGVVPEWPEYEPGSRRTMVFDDKSAVVTDPDGEQRAAWDDVIA